MLAKTFQCFCADRNENANFSAYTIIGVHGARLEVLWAKALVPRQLEGQVKRELWQGVKCAINRSLLLVRENLPHSDTC